MAEGAALALALLLLPAGGAHAQPRTPAAEATLALEAVAVGARYLHGSGPLRLGAGLALGPQHGVRLAGEEPGRERVWASAHAVLAYQTGAGVRVLVAPLGAALLAGDDFAGIYPAGAAGLELVRGTLRIASLARVVRVAEPEGSGDYRVVWVPLRLGWARAW